LEAQSCFLSFQGLKIHFRLLMPDQPIKNRVLIISSPLINTFHWRKLLPQLSESDTLCVIVDLPGFGHSEYIRETPMSAELRARLMWGVLDEIDRQTSSPMSMWHIVGHGAACATLVEMYAQAPQSVSSQVHICPIFSRFSMPEWKKCGGPGPWFDKYILTGAGFAAFIEKISGYKIDDYILFHMRRPFLRPGARSGFLRMLNALRPPQPMDGFCPVMALWGARDPFMDERAVRELNRILPEAEKHVLKTAGHLPMETHARALNDYLRGWFQYLS